MQKLIKTNPPKVRWVDIHEQKPLQGTHLLFGLVNEGSPHECFSKFFAKYEPELGKFVDFHGDVIDNTVTHFLYIE